MRPISAKNKDKINEDTYYSVCARKGADCSGRITIEHAFIYASRQIDEIWNFVPLCWYHHLGAGMNKNINEKIALSKATDEDLAKYPKKDWQQLKKRYGLCN